MRNLDSMQRHSLHCHHHRNHQLYEHVYRPVDAIAGMKVFIKPAIFIPLTSLLNVPSTKGCSVRCRCDAM